MRYINKDKAEVFAGEIENYMEELREHIGWLNHRPEDVDINVWIEKVKELLNKIIEDAQDSLREISQNEKVN